MLFCLRNAAHVAKALDPRHSLVPASSGSVRCYEQFRYHAVAEQHDAQGVRDAIIMDGASP